MAKINQALLDRLVAKLRVSKGRVYALIQEISAKNRVPRHLGALLLAGDNGISQQKYATDKDLADLRGIPHHVPVAVGAPGPAATSPRGPARKAKGKTPKTKENTVFVVHGRDAKLRDSMYELLGALGLKAQEWGHAIRAVRGKGGNPYVNDAVNRIMERAQAVVVILSPDDLVTLKKQFWTKDDGPEERKPQGQARPNVIFETGIAVGTHHQKTLIVQCGKVKPFTDIGGMHVLRLTGSPASRQEFRQRLASLGCDIDRDGDHWLRAGDFTPMEAKAARKARGKIMSK